MPRASWNGHLRLSLVSCPVYLSPATTVTKRIRLNQINGTLLEPEVLVDFQAAERSLDGALALVRSCSIKALDGLFAVLRLCAAGVHVWCRVSL